MKNLDKRVTDNSDNLHQLIVTLQKKFRENWNSDTQLNYR